MGQTDLTLSSAITLGQSGPGSNNNEGGLCIPQSSSITETSPSDCLVPYLVHSSYPSAEMQSMCSITPANWATILVCKQISTNFSKNKITYKLFTHKFYMYNHLMYNHLMYNHLYV